MNTSIHRSLALLIAGALIGIFGSLLIPVLNIYFVVSGVVLIIFLFLYGSGAISPRHRYNMWRRRCKWLGLKVGILNDIESDIKNEEIHTHIRTEEWKKRIEQHAKNGEVKIKVNLINVKEIFDSYAAIINPYGGVYPESDLKNFKTLDRIFNYVGDGGLFVNVEDIFGYFAYNALLRRKLDATPPAFWDVEREPNGRGKLVPRRPFERTPSMEKLGLRILNTENTSLYRWNIEFENTFRKVLYQGICGVKVHRVVVVEKNVEPVVKPKKLQSGEDVTPLCFVNYGNEGKFLMSLFWISKQEKSIQEKLEKILAKLVVNFIKSRAKKDRKVTKWIVFAFVCVMAMGILYFGGWSWLKPFS